MYTPVSNKADFPGMEGEVLTFWKEHDTFQKSLALRKNAPEVVFYDGPPFPTGAPHIGTIFVSILKDTLARYFTMAGHSVPRRWGWDCHGLPIENAVEKQLGIKDKTEIEKTLGVASFNDACRTLVADCNTAWESYINKIGRWVDYRNAYRTLDLSYMESVLWVFKQCYDKGLIYKDYRVTPYCYHCETSLSFSDIRESDSTRPRQDPEVVVRFRALEELDGKPTYYLAWTTTPWTLTSNLALAVGADHRYAIVEHEGALYIMAEALVPKWAKVFGGQPRVASTLAGSELVGRAYEPVFPYYRDLGTQGYFRILAADFVTLEDGVGIVHLAPAFGEDDYWLCKRNGLGVRNPVDAKGCFTAEIPELAGHNVHHANKDVIRLLKAKGDLVYHGTVDHNYPHCWRCRAPLIYRAMDAWYFGVEKLKDRLLAHNEEIHWVPEHVKHGRFGKWLEGARDWNISRSRYWGAPIPVWECENSDCGERRVLGSLAEIREASGRDLTDLHKEFLDDVSFACSACGHAMRRVPEVLDCWFESGAMPFGQCHYPFENKDWFETHFPADFIVEYPGQIRGWFYYLHVLAVALLDRASFKNCLVHGTLLAADGGKISKSKKNFTDPMELIEHFGADALRLYLLSSPAVAMDDLSFKDSGVQDQIKQVLLPFWNSYSFFVTYANIDGWDAAKASSKPSANVLDRWILSSLDSLIETVTAAMDGYDLQRAVRPFVKFIEDLTNWYIRRSRRRFWKSQDDDDKALAYRTLNEVLIQLSKVAAPFIPFMSENIYRNLRTPEMPESVHLCDFPAADKTRRDPILESEMDLAMTVVKLGRLLRAEHDLKVRQPLSAIHVVSRDRQTVERIQALSDIVLDELNVKKADFGDHEGRLAILKAKPDFKRLGPRFGGAIKKVAKAISTMDERAIEALAAGGTIRLAVEGESFDLASGDVVIERIPREGLVVASEGNLVVALETELTHELVQEGLVREFVNKVQNMRKTADLEVTRRIRIDFSADEALRNAVERNADYVSAETLCLACSGVAARPADATDWDINGHACSIRMVGA